VLTLHYRRVLPNGNLADERRIEIKGVVPFKGESSSDKIRAGETVEYRFGPLTSEDRYDVWLRYKLFPWQLDAVAEVIAHVSAHR